MFHNNSRFPARQNLHERSTNPCWPTTPPAPGLAISIKVPSRSDQSITSPAPSFHPYGFGPYPSRPISLAYRPGSYYMLLLTFKNEWVLCRQPFHIFDGLLCCFVNYYIYPTDLTPSVLLWCRNGRISHSVTKNTIKEN